MNTQAYKPSTVWVGGSPFSTSPTVVHTEETLSTLTMAEALKEVTDANRAVDQARGGDLGELVRTNNRKHEALKNYERVKARDEAAAKKNNC